MSNKMALDALTAALDAMEHMANTLNNMDAVDEDEDAQHDAAFEAVRAAIAELEQPKKSRIVAASMDYYPESDQRFFNFWYGHMFEDLMQPPLVGIDHATARYIWNAAAIAALQAAQQGWRPISEAPLFVPLQDPVPPAILYSKEYGVCMGAAGLDQFGHIYAHITNVSGSVGDIVTHFHALPAAPPKD